MFLQYQATICILNHNTINIIKLYDNKLVCFE